MTNEELRQFFGAGCGWIYVGASSEGILSG